MSRFIFDDPPRKLVTSLHIIWAAVIAYRDGFFIRRTSSKTPRLMASKASIISFLISSSVSWTMTVSRLQVERLVEIGLRVTLMLDADL